MIIFIIIGTYYIMCTPGYVSAQSNPEALEEAFAQVRNAHDRYADTLAVTLSSKFKHDPDVQLALAKAYFRNRMDKTAEKYVEKALKIDSKFSPAHIFRGDMAIYFRDTTAAVKHYLEAVKANSSDIKAYSRYTDYVGKEDPETAVRMLEQLRIRRPDAPVNLMEANVWFRAGRLSKAVETYRKVDRTEMEEADILNFAASLYGLREYNQSIELTKFGLETFPGSYRLTRLAFYDYVELKQFKEASEYGDLLFCKADSVNKVTYRDYDYYAIACKGKGEYKRAVDTWMDVINNDTVFLYDDRTQALQNLNDFLREVRSSGNYDEAASLFLHYISLKKSPTAYDYYRYADIYKEKLDSVMSHAGDAIPSYSQLSDAYAYLERNYPTWESIPIVYYYHASYCSKVLDPESDKGLARPYYEGLIKTASSMPDDNGQKKTFLMSANWYLGYYYYLKKDYARSHPYWQKILALDPGNEQAKLALSIMK